VTRYLVLRLVQTVPVLFGVSVIVFLLIRLIPGDPALAILGDRVTPAALARLHEEMGLDLPIWAQYVRFLDHALHGDFGTSLIYRTDVLSATVVRIPLSLLLIGYAAVLALVVAVPLATIAALRRGGVVDQAVRLSFTTMLSIPAFWLGLMLILVLGVKLRIFPVGGAGSGGLDTVWHLTLPAGTIALSIAPILVRSLRSSLINVLSADFVTTGRAMGLPTGTLVRSYLLRNSILPVILILSINVGWLLSGTVIVEQVFGIPGVGSLLANAITTRDYAFIQLVALFFALVVILVNLATDLLYAALDPRVSLHR
jgi:peptide/nickel transport system permease protein